MSVVQDRLMTQAPENRSKSHASRAEKNAQERDSTAFSELYAREKGAAKTSEAAPAKRAEGAEKARSEAPEDAKEPAQPDEVAEASGKELPSEDVPPQTDSQTLEWLGLAEEPAAIVVEAAALMGLAVQQMPVATELGDALQGSEEAGELTELNLETSDVPLKNAQLVLVDEESLPEEETTESLSKTLLDKAFTLKPLVEEMSSQTMKVSTSAATETQGDTLLSRLASMAPPQVSPLQAGKAMPLVPGQPVPMNQPGWSDAVVDRVMWLSSQNLKSAEIQLDPAELGRMEVRISLGQESTQITFSSLNANVRDALESQMYRLRELFAQQGMNQLDVNVSDQSLQRGSQEANQAAGSGRGTGDGSGNDELDEQVQTGMTPTRQGLGLVDYYA